MARKKKTEGEEVRLAFTGPSLGHDELIDFAEARNREDKVRASSAGESRQKIGEFLDETGMNGQALSILRSILKKPDTQKAMDVIRSLEVGLPMVKAHVTGQSTPDMLSEAQEPVAELPKPIEEELERFSPDDGENAGDDELGREADEFDAHLAQVAE